MHTYITDEDGDMIDHTRAGFALVALRIERGRTSDDVMRDDRDPWGDPVSSDAMGMACGGLRS